MTNEVSFLTISFISPRCTFPQLSWFHPAILSIPFIHFSPCSHSLFSFLFFFCLIPPFFLMCICICLLLCCVVSRECVRFLMSQDEKSIMYIIVRACNIQSNVFFLRFLVEVILAQIQRSFQMHYISNLAPASINSSWSWCEFWDDKFW